MKEVMSHREDKENEKVGHMDNFIFNKKSSRAAHGLSIIQI